MKRSSVRIFLAAVLLAFSAFPALAGSTDLEIHCFPKRMDQDGASTAEKQHWAYDVTVESKMFADAANLQVKYVIFIQAEEMGRRTGPVRRKAGSFTIDALKAHEKKLITTEVVELKKSAPRKGRTTKAKPKPSDVLVGLWVRVYQNGQLLTEYANPSSLTTQEKFE